MSSPSDQDSSSQPAKNFLGDENPEKTVAAQATQPGKRSPRARASSKNTRTSDVSAPQPADASGQSSGEKRPRGNRKRTVRKTPSSPQAENEVAMKPAPRKKTKSPKNEPGAVPESVPDAPASGAVAPEGQHEEAAARNRGHAASGKTNGENARAGTGKSRGSRRARRSRPATEIPEPIEITASPMVFHSAVSLALAVMRFPALPVGESTAADKPAAAPRKTRAKARQTVRESARQPVKRMFISVLPGEQVEVALAEDGIVLEYYLDMLHQRKIKGNIYKGVIHNIDTNLQAAFVNYGAEKNGFLQIDQVHPEYWQTPHDSGGDRKFPPIQKVLHTGQEVLVQVVKEPAGSKGAFLTTWLSLAGRFLVLTPGQEQIGVSRKVTDNEERKRLRDMMNGIDPGNGLGVIVRTVGEGATKTTLKNDLQYLKRLWRDIRKKATEVGAPALIHQEPGLSERAVRDYLTEDVREIWVDNDAEASNVRAMANLLFPRKKDLVQLYSDVRQSIWEHFSLDRQLDQIYAREVALPSGGRLVFDQTEALMAIDINSGKISGKGNFEAMAFKTNMEAAESIAQQLRLRDVGGQVVIDFIEMRDKKHVLEVEKTLRQAMKSDRAKHDVARMSSFGLLELVRQRMGSSALSICMETCAACGGTGLRRNLEWQALQALRELRHKMKGGGPKYVFEASRELGLYLLNYKREALHGLENDFGKTLEIKIQI